MLIKELSPLHQFFQLGIPIGSNAGGYVGTN